MRLQLGFATALCATLLITLTVFTSAVVGLPADTSNVHALSKRVSHGEVAQRGLSIMIGADLTQGFYGTSDQYKVLTTIKNNAPQAVKLVTPYYYEADVSWVISRPNKGILRPSFLHRLDDPSKGISLDSIGRAITLEPNEKLELAVQAPCIGQPCGYGEHSIQRRLPIFFVTTSSDGTASLEREDLYSNTLTVTFRRDTESHRDLGVVYCIELSSLLVLHVVVHNQSKRPITLLRSPLNNHLFATIFRNARFILGEAHLAAHTQIPRVDGEDYQLQFYNKNFATIQPQGSWIETYDFRPFYAQPQGQAPMIDTFTLDEVQYYILGEGNQGYKRTRSRVKFVGYHSSCYGPAWV